MNYWRRIGNVWVILGRIGSILGQSSALLQLLYDRIIRTLRIYRVFNRIKRPK